MKNRIFKRILTASLTAAISLTSLTAFAGCGNKSGQASPTAASAPKSADGLRTLRVAIMTGLPDQYATYIGSEQGIFKKYKINLTTTEHVAGINTIDAVQNGTADTGVLADFAAANRFGNTHKNTNLQFFSELSVSSPKAGGVYVDPQYKDNLDKLENGKGWVTNIGTVAEYYNWQAQKALNIDPEKQKVVQTDSNQTTLALVKNKDASAIVAQGADTKYYEEYGWVKVLSSEEVGIKTYSYLLSTKEFIDTNKDLLSDYLKALDESIEYISANLDEVAPKVEKKFGIKAEDFKINWKAQKFSIGFSEEGVKQLDDLNNWALEHKKYSDKYDIRDFVNTTVVDKAFKDRDTVKK